MLEVILTVIPLVCWILLRCYQLLYTPTEKLARHLTIEIPHVLVVSVDSITATTASLHWDIESGPHESLYFVVLLNGTEVCTLAQKSVKLCLLASSELYLVQVLAVNASNNFTSQSAVVRFYTAEERRAEPVLLGETVEFPFEEVPEKTEEKAGDPRDLPDLHELHELQQTLCGQMREMAAFAAQLDRELGVLRATFAQHKKELGEESDLRAKKDLDMKHLEKQKDLLAFERLKLTKHLRAVQNNRQMHHTNLAELRSRVAKLEEKRLHTENTNQLERLRVDNTVRLLHGDISAIRMEMVELEQLLRQLTNERKELHAALVALGPLVEQFTTFQAELEQNDMFTKDGQLTRTGGDLLKRIFGVKPDWEGDLRREADAVALLEQAWRSTFRLAVRKYVSLHNAAEAAKAAQDPSYVAQKLNEHQASIEFGGFAHALPKPKQPKVYTFSDDRLPLVSPPSEEPYNYYNQMYQDHVMNEEAVLMAPSILSSSSVLNSSVPPRMYNPLATQNYLSTSLQGMVPQGLNASLGLGSMNSNMAASVPNVPSMSSMNFNFGLNRPLAQPISQPISQPMAQPIPQPMAQPIAPNSPSYDLMGSLPGNVYGLQQGLWNNSSSRLELQLLDPLYSQRFSPQPMEMPQNDSVLNNLLLNPSLPNNKNIWADKRGHDRVALGSSLWRNDVSPSGTQEFQPFLSLTPVSSKNDDGEKWLTH